MIGGAAVAPIMVWLFANALCWAPTLADPRFPGTAHAAWSSVLLGAALWVDQPAVAAVLLAVTAGLHAVEALAVSRTSAAGQIIAALLMSAVAGATLVGGRGWRSWPRSPPSR
jgi:hypothetical protein